MDSIKEKPRGTAEHRLSGLLGSLRASALGAPLFAALGVCLPTGPTLSDVQAWIGGAGMIQADHIEKIGENCGWIFSVTLFGEIGPEDAAIFERIGRARRAAPENRSS